MLNFLEGNKYLTENDCSFHKEKTYFEAVNNQEEYFKRNQKNMLYGISEQYSDEIVTYRL